MGIEPTLLAWKAKVLPLNYTRLKFFGKHFRLAAFATSRKSLPKKINLVEGGGFEPPKAEPTDLQSVPFGHSGTPPEK